MLKAEALLEDRPVNNSRYLTEYKDYEFFAFLITNADGREEPCLAWFGSVEADSQITCTTGGAVSGHVSGVGEATFYVEGIAESKANEHTHGVAISPYIVVEDASANDD